MSTYKIEPKFCVKTVVEWPKLLEYVFRGETLDH